MARHVVLGRGNLGTDLDLALRKAGHEVFTPSVGSYRYPGQLPVGHLMDADFVWCAIGAGSVEAAKEDFRPFLDLHVRLPMELAQHLPEKARLILFSTDYCSEPGFMDRSLYSLSKRMMEHSMILSKRENVRVYRIGSLYGSHRPDRTLPGKLARRLEIDHRVIELPVNRCRPTSTQWLAEKLVAHQEEHMGHLITTAAPMGVTTVLDWAKEMFPDRANQFQSRGIDESRPVILESGSLFGRVTPDGEDWRSVWRRYKTV